MTKLTLKIEKEVNAKTLLVKAGVRYWEDADVNGTEDTEGKLIPCRQGDMWCPVIDVDTGIITNWNKGTTADIHYKVCDQFSCCLKDELGNEIHTIEDEYVPEIMCPKDSGYGDYIIMDIDAEGKIKDWKPMLLDDLINTKE